MNADKHRWDQGKHGYSLGFISSKKPVFQPEADPPLAEILKLSVYISVYPWFQILTHYLGLGFLLGIILWGSLNAQEVKPRWGYNWAGGEVGLGSGSEKILGISGFYIGEFNGYIHRFGIGTKLFECNLMGDS